MSFQSKLLLVFLSMGGFLIAEDAPKQKQPPAVQQPAPDAPSGDSSSDDDSENDGDSEDEDVIIMKEDNEDSGDTSEPAQNPAAKK